MKTLTQYINEGITFNNDKFEFDFTSDNEHSIIKLVAPKLKTAQFVNDNITNVYHFAFEFESNADSKIRTKFFNDLRFCKLEPNNRKQFIDTAIMLFTNELRQHNLRHYDFGSIVYPASRSIMNQEIIRRFSKFYKNDWATFELIKQLPNDIEFDFYRYTEDVLNQTHTVGNRELPKYTEKQKLQNIDNIKQMIIDISNSDYFSVANSVKKNNIKQYFSNFLKFKNDDELTRFKSIEASKAILIIDDVATTGTTINEIIKIIRSINIDAPIVIFTVIGKFSVFG